MSGGGIRSGEISDSNRRDEVTDQSRASVTTQFPLTSTANSRCPRAKRITAVECVPEESAGALLILDAASTGA